MMRQGKVGRLLAALLLTSAIGLTLGAGQADAKKRKTVRVPVSISLLYIQSFGTDRFTGLVSSSFTRCSQFGAVLLTRSSGTSASGPFTPTVQVVQVDSGPAGTFQILAEPSFVPPYTVERYEAQTPERAFNTRRKRVVCQAGLSPAAFAFQPPRN